MRSRHIVRPCPHCQQWAPPLLRSLLVTTMTGGSDLSQPNERLRRELSARQVQMIAIAGTIGTGLFLGMSPMFPAALRLKRHRHWSFSCSRWASKYSNMLRASGLHCLHYPPPPWRNGDPISRCWILQCLYNALLLTCLRICSILELLVQ